MSIIKKPFVNYTLDEDKDDSAVEVISLKLNKSERALIDRLIKMTKYNQSKVIKISLQVCEKVILNNFGSELFMKLTSTERSKSITENPKEVNEIDKK
jgi:hypothetical protein